jgi:hypothetical protein
MVCNKILVLYDYGMMLLKRWLGKFVKLGTFVANFGDFDEIFLAQQPIHERCLRTLPVILT